MASNNDPLHEHVAALNVQDESTKDPDPSSNKNSGTSPNHNPDYDLSTPIPSNSTGLRQSLPSYGDAHFSLFLRKAFIKSLGYTDASLSLPIIGIANTFSAFNPCHANVPQLLEAVKRGVLMAGGLPMEFPTVSLHEAFAGGRSSMFLRNLMAMDTEEMVRGQPVDAVVLIGGCDKTVPAQLMGGISANKPIVHLVTGPMMPGSHDGARIGACTDCRNNWAKYRAGTIDMETISAINDELAPTAGTCGVMGTASTMACILATLGLMPFKGATAPAVSSARLRVAEETGKLAVSAFKQVIRPQDLLTRESFLNAITVLQAIGGSTNAVVHLLAIINRHPAIAGTITLDTFDEIGRKTPLLVDLKPSGDNYMTDFHNSGGLLALLHELRPLLHLKARTISGRTLGEEMDASPFRKVPRSGLFHCIQPFSSPLYPSSSLVVLKGNLAPHGCVIKASASKYRHLLRHTGPAVVFTDSADLARRIDDPRLEVTKDSVLVLQKIGPRGHPGMPEAGLIPVPRKLAREGVEDMLRISDGRISGTAGGTIVVHISPEAAVVESVFGIVRDGDLISIDIESRKLDLVVDTDEIQRRIEARTKSLKELRDAGKEGEGPHWLGEKNERGYRGLYVREVNQAHEGADFKFLTAAGPAG